MSKTAVQQVRKIINQVGVQTDECLMAEHQQAMRARDVEELVQSAIKGFRSIRHLREKGVLCEDQLITLSWKPQEFGRSILKLIDVVKSDNYEIDRENEFRELFNDFTQEISFLKDKISKKTPQKPPGNNRHAVILPPCDSAIDMSLLVGVVTGLLIAAYTHWSVWAGFGCGTIVTAVLCALDCSLRRTPGLKTVHHG
jgi:hypothetical protein